MVLLPLGKEEEGGGVGVEVRRRSRVKKVREQSGLTGMVDSCMVWAT